MASRNSNNPVSNRSRPRVRSAPPPRTLKQKAGIVLGNISNAVKKGKRDGATHIDLNGALSDITASVTTSLSNPTVLLVSIAALAVVVTSATIFTETGFIGAWTKDNTNPVAVWIAANQQKFLGLIIAAPTIFAAPKNLQVLLALASFFWIMLVPESTVYQYLFQALALHTYFRVKHPNSRMVILIATFAAYYLGWVVLTPPATS